MFHSEIELEIVSEEIVARSRLLDVAWTYEIQPAENYYQTEEYQTAFALGAQRRRENVSYSENPYTDDPFLHEAWDEGWCYYADVARNIQVEDPQATEDESAEVFSAQNNAYREAAALGIRMQRQGYSFLEDPFGDSEQSNAWQDGWNYSFCSSTKRRVKPHKVNWFQDGF